MILTYPFYTSLAAGLVILLQTALMMSVGFRRIKHGQGIGDGGFDDLTRLVRRHGNLAENSAIFLVVLALLEVIGGAAMAVATLAAIFVFARLMHAIGLSLGHDGPNAPRFLGAMGTMISCMATGGYLLYVVVLNSESMIL
jgi:uncharacterized membrane protein YecN with MAPEG domain